MSEEKIKLDDKVIYKNKDSIRRKQYNFSIQPKIIDKIIKIQKGLQLLVDTPILRGEIIEDILIKGLNSSGESIIVDNQVYNFQELIDIQEWCEKDLIKDFTKQLSTIEGIKKIQNSMKSTFGLRSAFGPKEEFDINNIEEINNTCIDVLWDHYFMASNPDYPIRNLKYIQTISIIDEIIKATFYLYNEIEILKNNYSKLKQIIENSYGKEVEEKDYNDLIVALGINYVSKNKKFNKELFEEEIWIQNKNLINDINLAIKFGTNLFDSKKEIEEEEEV